MSLSLLTSHRPRLRVKDDRNNSTWIITREPLEPSGERFTARLLGDRNGTPGRPGSAHRAPVNIAAREITANFTSGLWEAVYSCNADGTRAEPVGGEEWLALCNTARECRHAASLATAALEQARADFAAAEAAANAAQAAATTAMAALTNAI